MQAIFGHLRRLDDGLARIEGLFLVATLTCMILLSIAQIILRNFFETSIPHGDVVNRHLVLWICFLGASMAAYRRRHIRIEILTRVLKGRVKDAVETVLDLASAFVCFLLFRASYAFVVDEREFAGLLFASVPVWVAEIIIPAGFLLLCLRFGFQALARAAGQAEEAGP